jgi:uncharacterized protein (TIGR00255 family)
MIKSMTAFAKKQIQKDFGMINWEIRSLNNRYLDLNFRLPDFFREHEAKLRELISRYLVRGKVDCSLWYQPSNTTNKLQLNQDLLNQLLPVVQQIQQMVPNNYVNVTDLMRWPSILHSAEEPTEEIIAAILMAFESALVEMNNTRLREGEKLKALIENRIEKILNELTKLRSLVPLALQAQRDRLLAKIAEVKISVDNNRLEQELLLLAQKIDIAEEIDRLKIHLDETKRVLANDPAPGKRLDFLMQELNREANTIASKSTLSAIIQISTELKVLIEQMREQIQNIE